MATSPGREPTTNSLQLQSHALSESTSSSHTASPASVHNTPGRSASPLSAKRATLEALGLLHLDDSLESPLSTPPAPWSQERESPDGPQPNWENSPAAGAGIQHRTAYTNQASPLQPLLPEPSQRVAPVRTSPAPGSNTSSASSRRGSQERFTSPTTNRIVDDLLGEVVRRRFTSREESGEMGQQPAELALPPQDLAEGQPPDREAAFSGPPDAGPAGALGATFEQPEEAGAAKGPTDGSGSLRAHPGEASDSAVGAPAEGSAPSQVASLPQPAVSAAGRQPAGLSPVAAPTQSKWRRLALAAAAPPALPAAAPESGAPAASEESSAWEEALPMEELGKNRRRPAPASPPQAGPLADAAPLSGFEDAIPLELIPRKARTPRAEPHPTSSWDDAVPLERATPAGSGLGGSPKSPVADLGAPSHQLHPLSTAFANSDGLSFESSRGSSLSDMDDVTRKSHFDESERGSGHNIILNLHGTPSLESSGTDIYDQYIDRATAYTKAQQRQRILEASLAAKQLKEDEPTAPAASGPGSQPSSVHSRPLTPRRHRSSPAIMEEEEAMGLEPEGSGQQDQASAAEAASPARSAAQQAAGLAGQPAASVDSASNGARDSAGILPTAPGPLGELAAPEATAQGLLGHALQPPGAASSGPASPGQHFSPTGREAEGDVPAGAPASRSEPAVGPPAGAGASPGTDAAAGTLPVTEVSVEPGPLPGRDKEQPEPPEAPARVLSEHPSPANGKPSGHAAGETIGQVEGKGPMSFGHAVPQPARPGPGKSPQLPTDAVRVKCWGLCARKGPRSY